MSEKQKCSVREGRFVEPCATLAENTDMISTIERGRGIFSVTYTNMKERRHTRSMFGVKSRAHPRGGFLFNFCPFCGTDISEPFYEHDEAPKPDTLTDEAKLRRSQALDELGALDGELLK